MRKWTTPNKSLALIIIILCACGWEAWRLHARTDGQVSYRTAVVKRGDVVFAISATGTIEPVEVVDVGAQVAGRISSFGTDIDGKTIDYISVVEEGAVLAKLDDSVYAAELAVAKAQMDQDKAGELSAAAGYEQAKSRLTLLEADWKRAQGLTSAGLEALSLYDSAKADYEVGKANIAAAQAAITKAKATIVQAQAAVDKAQRNLDFCTIKSPVKGVIIDRRVNIGQTVVASLNAPSLFLIAKDLTKMQIWAGVNEADIGRIVPGAPVTFSCDTFPGHEFAGKVGKVRLNATMTQNVVMYTVEIDTENPENILLPYLTANVHFVVQKETNVLIVPNAALSWSPSTLRHDSTARPETPAPTSHTETVDSSISSKQIEAGKVRRGTIWVMDGKTVSSVDVNIGVSDGSVSAIFADSLKEGQEIVIGEIAKTAQSSGGSPFIPPIQQKR